VVAQNLWVSAAIFFLGKERLGAVLTLQLEMTMFGLSQLETKVKRREKFMNKLRVFWSLRRRVRFFVAPLWVYVGTD
jgi:hypothetical protein